MSRLSVDSIVRINIGRAPQTTAGANGCNVGLILGTTSPITTSVRVKRYGSLGEMLSDNFTASMAEYSAAEKYFAQVPAPSAVYVGKYTGGSGNGAETPVEGYAAVRDIVSDFYGVYCCGASAAENVALATAIQSMGDNCLFFESNNADCLVASPETADIFTTLKGAGVTCAIGIYSETEYAGAALMGLAMGLETGEAGSAFDMFLKKLTGITPTANITEAQMSILKGKNGNAYITRGQNISMIEPGNCTDGIPYDETMYLELTQRTLQESVLEQMTRAGVAKIPQTDSGMATLVSAVTSGMEYMRALGFVGPGTWTADPFRSLETGDMLDNGYLVFADSFDDLSPADRADRKSPNIYVAAKLAGSVRSVVIGVNVNE